jgi:hypothetical protein
MTPLVWKGSKLGRTSLAVSTLAAARRLLIANRQKPLHDAFAVQWIFKLGSLGLRYDSKTTPNCRDKEGPSCHLKTNPWCGALRRDRQGQRRGDGRACRRELHRSFSAALPWVGVRPRGRQAKHQVVLDATPGHHRIEDQIAEGDKVVTRPTAYGAHDGDLPGIPRTGNKLEMTAIVIHRIANGKLAEKWANKDVLGFLQQLGVFQKPDPA